MKHFGLLGEHLSHSISPQIHQCIYQKLNINADYSLIEFPREDLEPIIKSLYRTSMSGPISSPMSGVNVTIPYKKDVIPLLDNIDDLARSIGSINTIKIDQGKLSGYNTDYYGIQASLEDYLPLKSFTFLILGYGGACLPLIAYLLNEGAEKIYIASRNPQKGIDDLESIMGPENTKPAIEFVGYDQLDKIKGKIVFNTTPLGMFPNLDQSALAKEIFKNFDIAIDLIYNPCETKFLRDARRSGLKCQNGLKMLVYQAIRAVEIWNNIQIVKDTASDIYKHFNKTNIMENTYFKQFIAFPENLQPIYLVGMPASGKTSLGRLLADLLGLGFVDLDRYIEDMTGKRLEDIFKKEGESAFRDYEEEALLATCRLENTIISTGGGCITRKKNREILNNSDMVFYIVRDCQTIIDKSSLEDRPLLRSDSSRIFDLYNNRKSYYEEVADYPIYNRSSLETALFDMVDIILDRYSDNKNITREGENINEK